MNVSHRPLYLAALLAPVLTACGTADDRASSDKTERPAPMPNQQLGAGVQRWDPPVGGREVLSLKRIGKFMGTSDLVKYGSDGSVVIVKLYGGGGSGIERCRLHSGELARLTRNVQRLPLDPPPHVRERPRPTFYTPPSPQYVLKNGRYIDTFTQDAMPRDARPLVRRLEWTLNGRVATCHTVYRTRRA
jgi:hypothetical protein